MASHNYDQASDFLDSLSNSKSRSAGLAIHLTWLNKFNSPISTVANMAKEIDLLLLYRAMVHTFESNYDYDASLGVGHDDYDLSTAQLKSVESAKVRWFTERFAQQLRNAQLPSADLDNYIVLFLECVNSEEVVNNIHSGLISEKSDELNDPNHW